MDQEKIIVDDKEAQAAKKEADAKEQREHPSKASDVAKKSDDERKSG
jgi:hypothetical protein